MIEGIDVSSWQGLIDWTKVGATSVKFAYIKATEGATYTNPNFERDWSQAAGNGIIRGAYHFLSATSEAQDQAANFLRAVKQLQPGDLPPALDIEGDKWSAVPSERKWQLLTGWLSNVERALAMAPVIYVGYYFAKDVLRTWGKTELLAYPLWVPNWNNVAQPLVPQPWDTYTFWQYTSKGTVEGINGNVDRNRFKGDENALRNLCRR